MMDLDDFRSILNTAGVDVWTFIDTAILVASLDYKAELKQRRDEIVERLYATCISTRCRNCDFGGGGGERTNRVGVAKVEEQSHHHQEPKEQVSPYTPQMVNGALDDVDVDVDIDDDDDDPYAGLFDDEQKRILEIRDFLEDPVQSEDSIIELLQSLADMDITFKALQETDIGRHVNRLRKHPSNDVKKLVKHLVRKWKDIVDEWVKMNAPGELASSAALMVDGDSPQQKIPQNGRHQVPDFAYSPNPHNGSSGSDKNNSEPERKPKPKPIPPRREAPIRPPQSSPAPQRPREQQQKESNFDAEKKLASARKRLQENYKEANDAKKQRTIQVMDIHEIPKPKNKNTFFAKHKGGSSQGRHW